MEAQTSPKEQSQSPKTIKHMDAVDEYLARMGETPLLSREQAMRLARRARDGDKGARDALIKANLRLVVRAAARYHKINGNKFELLDLIQEGNLGVMKAVTMYNPDLNYAFSTYASHWIKQHIVRFIKANLAAHTRIPENVTDKHWKARKDNPGEPTPYQHLFGEPVSLDKEMLVQINGDASEEMTLGSVIEDPDSGLFIEKIDGKIKRAMLMKYIDTLQFRERFVVMLRFGFEDGEHYALHEIGDILNISRERVRQITDKAVGKIRERMILDGNYKIIK